MHMSKIWSHVVLKLTSYVTPTCPIVLRNMDPRIIPQGNDNIASPIQYGRSKAQMLVCRAYGDVLCMQHARRSTIRLVFDANLTAVVQMSSEQSEDKTPRRLRRYSKRGATVSCTWTLYSVGQSACYDYGESHKINVWSCTMSDMRKLACGVWVIRIDVSIWSHLKF